MPSVNDASTSAPTPEGSPEFSRVPSNSLLANAWSAMAGTDARMPHEKTTAYARKLLDEIQAAREHLEMLLAENDATVTVTVTTAVPMDDLLRVKVIHKGEEMFNAPIQLVEQVDPSILGGIILETPGRRYDASIKAQLASVHKALLTQDHEGGAQYV